VISDTGAVAQQTRKHLQNNFSLTVTDTQSESIITLTAHIMLYCHRNVTATAAAAAPVLIGITYYR